MDPKLLDELDQYMTPMRAMDRPLHPKIELFGHYKIGKTVLSCMLGPRPLLIATDSGWVSIKDWMPGPNGVDLSNTEHVDLQGIKHLELISQAIEEDVPTYREFDPIVIDPFSKLIDEYVAWLLKFRPSQADSRVYWDPIDPTDKSLKRFATSGMGDYNAAKLAVRPAVYSLCRANRTVVFVCHVKEPGVTDTEGTKEVRASLPGKTHELLAREVDLLAHMENDNGNRTVSFVTSKKKDVGSRALAINGKTIKAEDFPQIVEKWKQSELK